MFLGNRNTGKKISIFNLINILGMTLICFLTIYPIWYIIINSLTTTNDSLRGNVNWWPSSFSLDSYSAVFKNSGIVASFGITVARSLLATTVHILFTSMVAYGLSKKYLVGRKIYMTIGIITMLFNGGLIPSFLLIKNLGMYDKFLVYIIPAMFSFYNLIIFASFFNSLPDSLEESAKMDGANEFSVFFRIVIPCSKAVFATLCLFVGVYHWNDYFVGVIYISNEKLRPIQTILYKIVAENAASFIQQNAMSSLGKRISPDSIKFATMVIATVPIVCVYPFLQRFFAKGLMIGSIKG